MLAEFVRTSELRPMIKACLERDGEEATIATVAERAGVPSEAAPRGP